MKRQARKTSSVKRATTKSRAITPTSTQSTASVRLISNTSIPVRSSRSTSTASISRQVSLSTTKKGSTAVASRRAVRLLSTNTAVGEHKLPDLPYDDKALEPHVSARTLSFHHGKHHNTYVTNLNNLIKGTDYEKQTLPEIIVNSHKNGDTGIFNNAAQHFNHDFFWKSMKPGGGGVPKNAVGEAIEKDFGSFQKFRDEFKKTAATHFGAGWAFLALDRSTKKLKVLSCHDADTPFLHNAVPIITTDVWEHAYYLDYQNRRPDYVESFLEHLANWDFADENYTKAQI